VYARVVLFAKGVPTGVVLVAVALGLVVVPAAAAVEPGVHVDPGSPAAKEYALPLSQARQTGQGPRSPSGAGALFGAGITRSKARSVSRPRRSVAPVGVLRQARLAADRKGSRAGAQAQPVSARAGSTSAGALSVPGGGGSLLAVVGGGVLVLALGAFLGVVLRGRRSAHTV
jgi:hypothetical protein